MPRTRIKNPTPVDVLRQMGFTVAWASSRMSEPVRVLDDVVVIDQTRPEVERVAAARAVVDATLAAMLDDNPNE